MQYERVKGTYDMLPEKSLVFKQVQSILSKTMESYGFLFSRTSVLQPMEMFRRAVGGETDIVNKEMFSIKSKSGKEYVLKPEETAPLMRAVIEENFIQGAKTAKLYYFNPLYRHERPQKGRYREFFQYGAEIINSSDVRRDCELILLGIEILNNFKIENYSIEINSIGCSKCRPEYIKLLKSHLDSKADTLCPLCNERKNLNPMRVLDCKNESCRDSVKDAPLITGHLCGECRDDFDSLKELLADFKIKYSVNPMIVRGLDYYTKTVFEFVESGDALGSQSTLIGGGRYDLLAEALGGSNLPSCGFAGGVERLILSLSDEMKNQMIGKLHLDAFIVHFGGETMNRGFHLMQDLRKRSLSADMLFETVKMKRQLSVASECSRFALIIGEDELKENAVLVKNMKTQEQTKTVFDADEIISILNKG